MKRPFVSGGDCTISGESTKSTRSLINYQPTYTASCTRTRLTYYVASGRVFGLSAGPVCSLR